jgi:ABC-type polysaccharide/polyol phosphate transport system ATPase subunit
MPDASDGRVPRPATAIEVAGVEKTFRIPHQQILTLKERALHPLQRIEYDELHALRDISFEVLEGEFFGIVGRNGSGKSTLLKCLAGIYRADAGRIRVAGRLSPFIELGVGFNPDLTARDNVIINAVMMGLSPREARENFDDIIAFAELEEFLDLKLKNYSSGMQVRLAFSVMVKSGADVLLIDEVLAVGDASFQQKCLDTFYRLRADGKTIVLVTHDMTMVDRFCHRAMLLEEGRIHTIGDPGEVGRIYLELNFARAVGLDSHGGTSRRADIAGVWLEDSEGRRVDSIVHGERLYMHVTVDAHERIERPQLHLWLDNDAGVRVFATNTGHIADASVVLEPGERMHLVVDAANPLPSGRHYIGCSLTAGTGAADTVVAAQRAADFVVYGGEYVHGAMQLDHDFRVQRERPEVPR